jgi:Pyruvate/2-oxoacid:ferredoxin oxidoreductase delta subunit
MSLLGLPKAIPLQEREIVAWISERCIHHRFETASCQACVDHCPSNAWLLDDEGLSLDTERCDGCCLCLPACPEQALLPPEPFVAASNGNEKIALFACDYSGKVAGAGVMPCVHALGTSDLLKLYRQRTRQLWLAVGNCESCPRSPRQTLGARVESLNRALRHDGLGAITITFVPIKRWLRQRREYSPAMDRGVSRRAFFRRALQGSLEQIPADKADPETHPLSPGSSLQELGVSHYRPVLPEIDAAACDCCLDCIRGCPHQVLQLQPRPELDENRVDLSINPTDCSGCGICADLCRPAAITIRHWHPQRQSRVVMYRSHSCPSCGVPVFGSSPTAPPDQPCAICKVSHRSVDRIRY